MPTRSVAPARGHRLVGPALAVALALLPTACELESRDANAPQLVQTWVPAEGPAPAPGSVPNVEVTGGANLVSLTGEFVRTCTQGQVGVTHAFDGANLTFRARFSPAASCASTAPVRDFIRYFAYLTQVAPNTYQVRVIHENDELAGGTGTVLQHTVTVF